MSSNQPESAPAQPSEPEGGSQCTEQQHTVAHSLGFRPYEVLNAIADAVPYYCAKGFDSFDKTILTSKALSKEKAHGALKGSVQLFSDVHGRIQQQMSEFEATALSSSLQVPAQLSNSEEQESTPVFDKATEQQLDQELTALRRSIEQATAARQAFEKHAAVMKQILAKYGNTAPLQTVTKSVAAGKENLAEDAAAIANSALQLQPLLKRAETIFAQRQDSKAGQAPHNAATLAEKIVVARKAAASGVLTEDLRRLRDCILLE